MLTQRYLLLDVGFQWSRCFELSSNHFAMPSLFDVNGSARSMICLEEEKILLTSIAFTCGELFLCIRPDVKKFSFRNTR